MALTKAQLIDLNANELVIDLDADTSITADTDDQIDIKIAGADDFTFTANTFTALSGSSIVTPTLSVTSSATISGGAINLAAIDIDGGTDIGAAVADADLFIIDDGAGGTNRKVTASRVKTYMGAEGGAFSVSNLDIDGATDIGAGIADADLFIIDDGAGGTNRKVAASRIKTYIGASTAADDLTIGDAAVTLSTSSGDITIDATANDTDIIFKGTDNNSDITMLTLDGSEAGAATFNNKIIATELDISGDVDVDGTLETDALSIASTAVTTTAAEINLIDGGTARGTTAVATGDGILINDGGTMRMTNVDTVSTYFAGHNVGGSNIVTTGALDSGSITSGFGAIDNGTSNIRSATITAETAFVPDAANGASLGTTSLEFADLYLHDGAQILFGADQDVVLTHAADAGLTLKTATTSDDTKATLTLQTGDTDIAANDVLGQLHFQAPDEGAGTDAILVAAGIAAISEGDFSASNNATKLSFQTGASEAASEKMSLSSAGLLTIADDLVIKDGGTIGSASDVDAIAIAANGVVTMNQIPVFSAGINVSGGNIAGTLSTAAQTNITTLGTIATFRSTGIDDNADALAMTIDSNENIFIGQTGNADSARFLVAGVKAISSGIPQQGINVADTKAMDEGVGGAIVLSGKYDGSGITCFGSIEGYKQNDTSGQYGGELVFKTRVHGGNNTEHMRIDSSGSIGLGSGIISNLANPGMTVYNDNSVLIARNGTPLFVGRTADDGVLIDFRESNNTEGTIAVSGSTVAYNTFTGSHWSRLVDNSKPTILRGTVMESLDAMVNWYNLEFDDNDGNLQKIPHVLTDSQSVGDVVTYSWNTGKVDTTTLNAIMQNVSATIVKETDIKHVHTKISATDEAKNVYGVFFDWDDNDGDEGYNDMMIAAVGTYVVRIHKDETVAKGNLLQSNGDGTAKVLAGSTSITADVLSTVFAKVLSNTKIETYDDGSFIVPCAFTNC